MSLAPSLPHFFRNHLKTLLLPMLNVKIVPVTVYLDRLWYPCTDNLVAYAYLLTSLLTYLLRLTTNVQSAVQLTVKMSLVRRQEVAQKTGKFLYLFFRVCEVGGGTHSGVGSRWLGYQSADPHGDFIVS